jgi:hypothetical protein
MSGVEMGCLEVFVGGIIMEALHRGRVVYAEEDYVAFGVKELGWPGVISVVVGIGGKGKGTYGCVLELFVLLVDVVPVIVRRPSRYELGSSSSSLSWLLRKETGVRFIIL